MFQSSHANCELIGLQQVSIANIIRTHSTFAILHGHDCTSSVQILYAFSTQQEQQRFRAGLGCDCPLESSTRSLCCLTKHSVFFYMEDVQSWPMKYSLCHKGQAWRHAAPGLKPVQMYKFRVWSLWQKLRGGDDRPCWHDN